MYDMYAHKIYTIRGYLPAAPYFQYCLKNKETLCVCILLLHYAYVYCMCIPHAPNPYTLDICGSGLYFRFLSIGSQKSLRISAKLLRAYTLIIQKNRFALQDGADATSVKAIHVFHVAAVQANHFLDLHI